MSNNEQQPLRFTHLTDDQVDKLPADLDHSAVDDLLGLVPYETWPEILALLADPVPPLPDDEALALGVDWAFDRRLTSEDPTIDAVLKRIYAKRDRPS